MVSPPELVEMFIMLLAILSVFVAMVALIVETIIAISAEPIASDATV